MSGKLYAMKLPDRSSRGKKFDVKMLDKKKGMATAQCHQCRNVTTLDKMRTCSYGAVFTDAGKRGRACNKKYCISCLEKDYPQCLDYEAPEAAGVKKIAVFKEWKCPQCREICVCGPCYRRREKPAAKRQKTKHDSVLPSLDDKKQQQQQQVVHNASQPSPQQKKTKKRKKQESSSDEESDS
eukprot:GILJ01006257.1.p1 GENE.GILJ01006257.1~~GILJ01006257.1.p1  ORF type:complete len:182 (+),score=27.82 GILJ01006257.1:95-640(+)